MALKLLALAGVCAALLMPGVTPSALAPDRADRLLSRADQRLYAAKDAGRDCVR